MHPPSFDDHFGFFQRIGQLAVEQLIAQLPVKRFAVAIPPWLWSSLTFTLDQICPGSSVHSTEPALTVVVAAIAKDKRFHAILPDLDTNRIESAMAKNRNAQQHVHFCYNEH